MLGVRPRIKRKKRNKAVAGWQQTPLDGQEHTRIKRIKRNMSDATTALFSSFAFFAGKRQICGSFTVRRKHPENATIRKGRPRHSHANLPILRQLVRLMGNRCCCGPASERLFQTHLAPRLLTTHGSWACFSGFCKDGPRFGRTNLGNF